MKALTIERLYKDLQKEIARGHKDYVVFVTDDEEANGYHALWYVGETPKDMCASNRKYCEDNNCDLSVCEDKSKSYYIG